MIKKCIKCNSEKDIDLFVKNRNVCKNCMSIYKQNYHQENKEIIKEKVYNVGQLKFELNLL